VYTNIVGASLLLMKMLVKRPLGGVDADLKAHANGLDTVISEGATTLSGGPTQRRLTMRARCQPHSAILLLMKLRVRSTIGRKGHAPPFSAEPRSLQAKRLVIAHRGVRFSTRTVFMF